MGGRVERGPGNPQEAPETGELGFLFRETQDRQGGPDRLQVAVDCGSRNAPDSWIGIGEYVNKQFAFMAPNMALNRTLAQRFSQTSQCVYILHSQVIGNDWELT